MTVSPVTVSLIGFIGVLAILTGAYLIQCGVARLAKSRVEAV